jgi:hypothetical protein
MVVGDSGGPLVVNNTEGIAGCNTAVIVGVIRSVAVYFLFS